MAPKIVTIQTIATFKFTSDYLRVVQAVSAVAEELDLETAYTVQLSKHIERVSGALSNLHFWCDDCTWLDDVECDLRERKILNDARRQFVRLTKDLSNIYEKLHRLKKDRAKSSEIKDSFRLSSIQLTRSCKPLLGILDSLIERN